MRKQRGRGPANSEYFEELREHEVRNNSRGVIKDTRVKREELREHEVRNNSGGVIKDTRVKRKRRSI
jgi:hypothetical protein